MVEYDRNSLKETLEPGTLKTCIVGVGGAGGNVLDRITLDRTVDAKLVSMHTDIRVLSHSMAPHKIQLGIELMRGVGAGGDPELGREAAVFSREQIREAVEGHDIVFLCTGLGGGTGSGAAPVVAEIAKSSGALVFLTATMPFSFEGKRRLKQAEDALGQLQKRADALILFENNRMGELILPKDGIQKAFTQADQLIAQSLRAVSTILTTPGLVKLGLDDLTAALNTSNGRCLFGFGEARGQNRGSEAVKRALKSPLIDQGRLLHQTRTLLVHIAGGESLTLLEVDAIMKQLGKNVPDQTHILFGVAVDAKLGDSVCVTLLSSLGLAQLNTLAAAAPPAEMLPLHDRVMPSVVDALPKAVETPPAEVKTAPAVPAATHGTTRRTAAPKPAPAPELIPDEELPAPVPQAQIPQPPVPRPAPVRARPAPPAAAVENMDLFFPENEPALPAAGSGLPELALETATQDDDLFHQATATLDMASQALALSAGTEASQPEDLLEEMEDAALPPTATDAEEVAESTPARPARPSIEDFVPIKPTVRPAQAVGLASVVAARPATTAPAQAVAHEQPAHPPAAIRPAAPSVVAAKSNGSLPPGEQTAFRFGNEEDRGRFQQTEPVLADGGEDLDVPTWMRLKRKLKR